tara:strand:- start:503 stop:829 length:327 start_codon:yes stop_codon:yes gene_type:complete
MRSGRLRHSCTFYEDTADNETIDPTWTKVAKLTSWPCNVVQAGADESDSRNDSQIESTGSFTITTRYHADINSHLQLIDHKNRTHAITQVISKDGRDRELILKTTVQN